MRVSYKSFAGEIPKESPDLLPLTRAQLSTNCDFADGKLKPINGGSILQTMANTPVKGIYTEDGVLFYTWPVETLAFKSPIIDDAYARMFYLQPSDGNFKVASTTAMTALGPSPTTSYNVGVPKPTIAPILKTVDRTTLPDYPSVALTGTAWWDYAGTKYSEATVALTTVTAFRAYTFTAPALPGSPPAGVTPTLCCRLVITDTANSGAVLMDLTVRAASTARSLAFPGGLELSMNTTSALAAKLNVTWGAESARAYTYTYQNTWGEESAPAPPATISPTYIQDVVVTVTAGVFTGMRPFDIYQVYRTYGTNTTYLRTAVTGAAPTFTDSSRSPTAVGLPLATTDWLPPQTGLAGLTLTPGGWFAAFKGNTLYKSAPFRPYAWPYSETFPTAIRGICVAESGLIVTTADGVYVVPATASQGGKLHPNAPQAGQSQRSMVTVDGAVAYTSHDGIVLVEGSIATIEASQRLFNRDKWRAMYGDIMDNASLRLSYHDGFIFGSSSTHAKGFLIRLDEDVGSFTRTDVQVDSTFQLPITDALYYSIANTVYRFRAGSALTFDWWGKDWVMPYELSMGAAFIRTTGSITVSIYADGVVVRTLTTSTGFFRIPPIRAHRWSVRLSGTGTVHEFQMAQSFVELKNV